MTAEDPMPAATRDLRGALIDIVDFTRYERMRLDLEPSIGSPAGKDDLRAHLFAAITGVPTKEPRMQANVMLASAEELIRALDVIYSDGLAVVVADKVLVRSALETCGRAYWLLAPGIETRERVARGLVERLHDLRATKRVLPRMADQLQDRIDDLKSEIRFAGFPVRRDQRWGDVVDEIRRPTQAEAMELVVGAEAVVEGLSSGELAQRYLSIAVHGHPSSVLLHRAADEELQPLGSGTLLAPIVMRSEAAALSVMQVALAFTRAAGAYRDLMQWRDERWDRVRLNFVGMMNRYDFTARLENEEGSPSA